MPRRYRSYYRRYRRAAQKYSVETSNINLKGALTQDYGNYTMIAPIQSQGMRKAKNFTLSISSSPFYNGTDDSEEYTPIAFALVYVPQGTNPSSITLGTESAAASLYEPNQNVILSGVYTAGDSALRIRSSLARNLNSGDSIVLCMKFINQSGPTWASNTLFAQLQYAIAY